PLPWRDADRGLRRGGRACAAGVRGRRRRRDGRPAPVAAGRGLLVALPDRADAGRARASARTLTAGRGRAAGGIRCRAVRLCGDHRARAARVGFAAIIGPLPVGEGRNSIARTVEHMTEDTSAKGMLLLISALLAAM